MTRCIEAVAYTVCDNNFERIREQAARQMLSGPHRPIWWAGLSGPDAIRADIVAWSSRGKANAMADLLRRSDAYAPFRNAISDILTFEHCGFDLHSAETLGRLGDTLDGAPIVELALHTALRPRLYDIAHRALWEQLLSRDAVAGGLRLSGQDRSDYFGNVLIWRSMQAWEEARSALRNHKALGEFFSGKREVFLRAEMSSIVYR